MNIAFLFPGKGRGKLVRRGTEAELSRTTEALIRNLPIGQVEEDEEEEEEEEGMYYCLLTCRYITMVQFVG